MQDYKLKALSCYGYYGYLCTIPTTYFSHLQLSAPQQHWRVVRGEIIINSLSAAWKGEHIEKEKAIKLTSNWHCLNYFKDSK
jgi:hypothetical protein